jgi:hypothetical protein
MKTITIKDMLLSYTSQGLTVENVNLILQNCNFRPNMPWIHVLHGRWPPYTNRSNLNRLQLELFKYNIKIKN